MKFKDLLNEDDNASVRKRMLNSDAYKKFMKIWKRFMSFCDKVGFDWNEHNDVEPFAVVEIEGSGKMIVFDDEEPRMPYDRYVISAGYLKDNGDVYLPCFASVDEYRQRVENRPSLSSTKTDEEKIEEYKEFYTIIRDWHKLFTDAKFIKITEQEADVLFDE